MEKRFIVKNSGRFGDYVLTDSGFVCGKKAEEEAILFTEEQAKAVCETLQGEVNDTTEAYFYDEYKEPYQFVDTNVKYESSKKEWEYLKPEIMTKFIMNIKNLRGDEFLGRLTTGCIAGGFTWSESPEGGKYWNDVEGEVHRYIAENK